jgi:chemotaxis protein methyltransferase CheR
MMQESYKINDRNLDVFREMIRQELGMSITKEKNYLLLTQISRLMFKQKIENAEELYLFLNEDLNNLQNILAESFTITHTYFFREKTHLKILTNDIILKNIRKPLIWCAASSSGEEVYSIIISLLEKGIIDFILVASDINKEVLFSVKKGIYNIDKMKDVDEYILHKYFERIDRYHFKVKDILKKNIIIKQINLIDENIFVKQFDYIFCRNVLLYFDRPTQKKVINILLKNLTYVGYLFLGQTEFIFDNENVESVFCSVYNKKKIN